jgi:ectoine hydroxylase-related dioxygenase (phytanoyl-CoA dioxygenase family)
VALTPTYGTNSMCLSELEPSYRVLKRLDFDFERFAEKVQYDDDLAAECAAIAPSLALDYGEFVAFDPLCLHATQNNVTDHTRISIDLRILTDSDRERMRITYRGTGRRRMAFAPGHYYDARLSSEL